MSYQVLARKWRPQNFKEMVGQQHVLRGLINALDNDRLHHAYLFTGTRGVGKTTVARILAKCLNCETGVTSEPCGTCGACQEIATGRFVDLIEVDAASRTKVEDTRELLDNVQYAPTHGRFKVYLIDEVHMLSGHSFNALLKTLEEPPAHVKFLFATTDPQKLPVTILSRCLQFNLKRMTLDMISGHLKHLLQAENMSGEEESIRLLSRAADGSMRDALSLMDQAIAFGNGSLVLSDVQEMLGSIANDPLIALIRMIAAGDGAGVIHKVEDMAGVTPDFAAATDALIAMLHQLAVLQVVQGADEDDDNLRELAQQLSKEDVQLYYQIAINGRRDLSLAPDPRSGFEMLLLRMLAFRPTRIAPLVSSVEPAANAGSIANEVKASTENNINVSNETPNAVSETTESDEQVLSSRAGAEKESTDPEPTTLADPEPTLAATAAKKKIIAREVDSEVTPTRQLADSEEPSTVGAPPVWDEYDQMLSQPSPVSSTSPAEQQLEVHEHGQPQPPLSEQVPTVNNKASVSHDATAPPWDVSVESAVEHKPEVEAPEQSASITDLLFADFPEDEPDESVEQEPELVSAVSLSAQPPVSEAIAEEQQTIASSPPIETSAVTEPTVVSVAQNADYWRQTIESLSITGLAAELAKNCVLDHENDEKIELHLDSSSEMLMTNAAINEIEAALATHFDRPRKLVVAIRELTVETPAQFNQRLAKEIQISAEQHIESDHFVRQLSDRFAARVVPGSVKPKALSQ
ncbi:MAG: DNA polymerase III subunit gamma/tau [Leucothrix sp.]